MSGEAPRLSMKADFGRIDEAKAAIKARIDEITGAMVNGDGSISLSIGEDSAHIVWPELSNDLRAIVLKRFSAADAAHYPTDTIHKSDFANKDHGPLTWGKG